MEMVNDPRDKRLQALKVVLGAAWADGTLQPEELAPIHTIVDELGLASHPDILTLLETPIPAVTYRHYLDDYLANHPTKQERQLLLGLIKRVVYADNEVSIEEGYILGELTDLLEDMSPDRSVNQDDAQRFRSMFGRLFRRPA